MTIVVGRGGDNLCGEGGMTTKVYARPAILFRFAFQPARKREGSIQPNFRRDNLMR